MKEIKGSLIKNIWYGTKRKTPILDNPAKDNTTENAKPTKEDTDTGIQPPEEDTVPQNTVIEL